MAQLPDKLISWLRNVLQNGYYDQRTTFQHVVQVLAKYPSIKPKTQLYTFEDGHSDLLVLLSGTIPVLYRGNIFKYPIAIWIPLSYPRQAPIVYVQAEGDQILRPGQHMDNVGRIFHPYLGQWQTFWDKSSVDDFISVLKEVFAKDPPVISGNHLQLHNHPAKIPLPPKEPLQQSFRSPDTSSDLPPNLPPKPPKPPGNDNQRRQSPVISQGPPIPPLPNEFRSQNQSPMTNFINHRHQHQHQQQPTQQIIYDQQYSPPPIQQFRQFPAQNYQQQLQQQHGLQPLPQPLPQASQFIPKSINNPPVTVPQFDLLTSPLDVTIPSQSGTLGSIPAPPIPPNPEKDALLDALSQVLIASTNRALDDNKKAVPALLAQQMALHHAYGLLQSEIDQLHSLDSTLDNNERILRSTIQEAEKVMRDAAGRPKPNMDDILVGPTVVGSQLYAQISDMKACEGTRTALVKGLDKGRISVDVFVKQFRSLAREEFLRKALTKKIAVGMGLDLRRI